MAIQLFFYMFARVGEIKAIKKADIDFEGKTVYLQSQVLIERTLNDDLSFSARATVVSDRMKGNTSKGYRKQYLTDEAITIIKKAIDLNPDSEYLFQPDGHMMSSDSFNRRLKKYTGECGVTYKPSRKIRFYNASTAYDGTNLVTVSKLMGHSQVATTLHYLRGVNKDSDQILAYQNLGLAAKS